MQVRECQACHMQANFAFQNNPAAFLWNSLAQDNFASLRNTEPFPLCCPFSASHMWKNWSTVPVILATEIPAHSNTKTKKPLAKSHIPIWFFPWSGGDYYPAVSNLHPSSFPTPHSIQPTCTLLSAGIHRTLPDGALKACASLCSWVTEVECFNNPQMTTFTFLSRAAQDLRPRPPHRTGMAEGSGDPSTCGQVQRQMCPGTQHCRNWPALHGCSGKSADCASGNLLLQTTWKTCFYRQHAFKTTTYKFRSVTHTSSKTFISRSLHKIMGAPWIAANIRTEKQVMLGKRKFHEHQNVLQNHLNTLRETLSAHAVRGA